MPEPTLFSLGGKVILQFGGTSLLGPALVPALSRAGATVVVASRSRRSLDPLIAAEQESGHTVHAEEVDMTAEPSLHALRDRVLPPAPAFLEHYAKETMLGRMAQGHEIGSAVAFFLSDTASCITEPT